MTPEQVNDILSVLNKADAPDGFHTRIELQELLGVSKEKVYEILAAIAKQGRLSMSKKQIVNIAGHSVPIPAYKILAEKKRKEARR